MKKLILCSIFCFFMANNMFAESWTVCYGYPKGPGEYKTVEMGGSGGDWTLDCEGDGTNSCCWGVNGWDDNIMHFTQSQVDQTVAYQLSIGNMSGQIYYDGTKGSYTIETVSQDQSAKPCFLWQVGVDANNNKILTVMVNDEGQSN